MMDDVFSADMGYRRYRRRCPACAPLRRLPRQKASVQETSPWQRPQKGHEGRNGRQGRSDVGGTDNKGTVTHRVGHGSMYRPRMHRLATVHARDNQPTTNDVTTQPISISASVTKVKWGA